jgi:adenine-specific DNA methylase
MPDVGTGLTKAIDSAEQRKARGAFFTPKEITQFICDWAIRDEDDRIFEPSAGDAEFLVSAVERLWQLGDTALPPSVSGVEIHPHSARTARRRIAEAGGEPSIVEADFFLVEPDASQTAVIGNPPFIRYQDFAGESRARALTAAMKAGVPLTPLSSSWAAFVVHSAMFLSPGGRMGLVLPAELLSVNYAAPVRRFLFERFRDIDLVLFDEQVFPSAEADVLLLLVDGFELGPASHASVHRTRNATTLGPFEATPSTWAPTDPSGKWTGLMVNSGASDLMADLRSLGHFVNLENWGDTTLGMVTGNNNFFALSPLEVRELELPRRDVMPLSPPGSAHLRGLELSIEQLTTLGTHGKQTWLFRPSDNPSDAALAYIQAGQQAGVNQAYKCRVRTPWYRVPLVKPADLLLTCMNADTPRLTTNTARVRHLNSVHGVYVEESLRSLASELLPLASMNSATMLSAEIVGRTYGGGILKLEPREADTWSVPSPTLVEASSDGLRGIKTLVAHSLSAGDLGSAVRLVDEVLLVNAAKVDRASLRYISAARQEMAGRRIARGKSGR